MMVTSDPVVEDVEKVAAKAVKSAGEATFEALNKKPRRVLNFTVYSADDSGDQISLTMRYRALSNRAYDDLQAAHPPTSKDKTAGAAYNLETFAPALISAVSVIPMLSYDQAKELYTNEDWSGGEVTSLFINALRVCNAGLDVPFSERD
jgi:hypothetical protein